MSPEVTKAALACAGCVSVIGLDFKLAPVLAGLLAVPLVRIPFWKKRWASELSFTALGMLGAFSTIVDHRLGIGPSFWCGIIFGAAASSLMEIGKHLLSSVWRDRLQEVARIILGMKGPEA